METTETSMTYTSDSFQLTPVRFYACLGIYLFAFFFKAQVLSLFWGAFLFAMLYDLSKQSKNFKRRVLPLLFRLLLCALFTYGLALGRITAVCCGNLLAALYVWYCPCPKSIANEDIQRFRWISLLAILIMSITLFTHGIIINS